MIKLLVPLLFFSSLGFSASSGVNEAERADLAIREASKTQKVAALEGLLTDDFIFVQRMGNVWDKKTYLDRIKEGKMATNVQPEDLKTRMYGDTAILTSRDHWTATDGSNIQLISVRVFVKQGGAWKLASQQATSIQGR